MSREPTLTRRPECYRSYLRVLAQALLYRAGPLQNKVDASDLVQETLLTAHAALPQFRGDSDQELAAWLRKILANKLADAGRRFARQKRDAALERQYVETLNSSSDRFARIVVAGTGSPSADVARLRELVRIAEALEQLPEDQRVAIELHHVMGYAVAEIAEQMDKSKPAVAGLLRRGLKQLRERLGGPR
ncbi:MAG: sigma-70 family RNA polymerase sigma factor [Deltaproteobacteria bacterium]|jgi:RNA polymerase sigma-70 factor (ECF subfamily)|nr:sigma-70 family RNA polymerase sigma factor [Deltaproteobacteria bacterium]MBW2537291.1 sigma-70 family RNA polymerase sigma factor [Deltaproteobacteria bacterium]